MAPTFTPSLEQASSSSSFTNSIPVVESMASSIPKKSPTTLKRSRLLTSNQDHVSNKRARRCVADGSDSSDDDFSSVGTSSPAKKNTSRSISMSAVAPATCFVTPPSPPHSSNAFGEFDSRVIEFYSDSDGDHKISPRMRHDSINIASLRRRASLLNQSGGAASAVHFLSHRKRRPAAVPQCDLVARARCFEYLVSSIDEVWAQYCSFTSYAEDEMYGTEESGSRPQMSSRKMRETEIPNSPISLYDEDANYSSTNESQGPMTPYSYADSATLSSHQYMSSPKCAMNTQSNSACLAPSEQPDSVRLLNVKKRLMNAKYFLQDLTDREDLDSSAAFWNRWDMVKYAAIELVEEDGDDDEVVENVTEELEDGRHYSCSY